MPPAPTVHDPFSVGLDATMPFICAALDPILAARALSNHLSRALTILAIRVTRHKPGRRCVIEYDVRYDGSNGTQTLVAKARAKGTPRTGFDVAQKLWTAGFDDRARDGITVAPALALVPEFHMSIFGKVAGIPASELIPGFAGLEIARRVAHAAHKLHCTHIPTHKRHSFADELDILRDRLGSVAVLKPELASRIAHVLNACQSFKPPQAPLTGIHRDFYPAQVIIAGDRCCLLDLDLYCEGDPALDIGNFAAHITEHALRTNGDPNALLDREEAMIGEYLKLSSTVAREGVELYKTLALARHIFISTQFPQRRHTTEPLLRLVEARLGGVV
ncbi:MAG: aminoglycoside phosphotransferase family protein [Verrucomicrobia subdivision 3 bacterium]|nr:aminoglycoside phosphotransferase family protein [Limisphaerales bacterium]